MESQPLFKLCESGDSPKSKYFLFNEKWDYDFYKSWCFNQGGEIILPSSVEEFQTQLDIGQRLVSPELHEKCVDSTGNIVIWLGYNDISIEGNLKQQS